jgi:uncharacterized repeat protein (TIGR02543 family)
MAKFIKKDKNNINLSKTDFAKICLFCLLSCLAFFILYISTVFSYKETDNKNVADAGTGFTNARGLKDTYYERLIFTSGTVVKVINNVNLLYGASVQGTVVLYIPKNITLTVTGTTGNAGITLHSGSKLIVVGEGTLNATGGNAGRGLNGQPGNNGYLSISLNSYQGGNGGNGGNGGVGAGAGIGGDGGAGGLGGSGGICEMKDCEYGDQYDAQGGNGYNGKHGGYGFSMGTLYVIGGMTVNAKAGNSLTNLSAGSGGSAGSGANDSGSGWRNDYAAGGGGGGGGGGSGSINASAIGGGAPGGGGGGGGGTYTSKKGHKYSGGASGSGGKGYFYGGSGTSATYDSYCDDVLHQASGGAGGERGEVGNAGVLYSDASTVSGRYRNYSTNGELSEINYTANFDAAGGSFKYSYDKTCNVWLGKTMTTVNLPTKEGFKFKGYYTSSGGGGTQYYNENGVATRKYDVIGNINLYAQWEALNYTITVMANEGTIPATSGWSGSGASAYKSVTFNTNYGTLPTPTRLGYNFTGWYTASTSGSKVEATTKMTTAKSHNLYAQWDPYEYRVKFNYSGGTLDGSTSRGEDLKYKQLYTFPIPKKSGYTLQKWECDKTSEEFLCDSNGNLTKTLPYLGVNGSEVIFKAVWKPNNYTLTADANLSGASFVSANGWAGSGLTRTKQVAFDASYGALPQVEREGYTPVGWFSARDEGGVAVTENTIMDAVGGKTIYQHWTINKYILYFDTQGGVLSGSNQKMLEYNAFYGTLPTPKKDGYIFKGWVASPGGNVYVSQSSRMGAKNVTIYADWQEVWANKAVGLNLSELGGSGLRNNPYIIDSERDLALLALLTSKNDSLTNKYFKQTANLDLTGNFWLPIGSIETYFQGHFDGNGYKIENISTFDNKNLPLSYVGLFGYVKNSLIENVNIISGDVKGNENVGALTGRAYGGSIKNCRNGAAVIGIQNCGFIGSAVGTKVMSCANYGDISAASFAGGIIGFNFIDAAWVEGCLSRCNIVCAQKSGGIIGEAVIEGTKIIACGFKGNIEKASATCGLIAGGLTGGLIEDCFATSSTKLNLCGDETTIVSCIYDNGQKFYIGSNFSNWSIHDKVQPLPQGLVWMAASGDKLNENILESLGYRKFE